MKDGQLFISKSKELLNIRWSRQLPSEPSSVTISKDRAGRYFASMLWEFEAKPMPVSNKTVGIDLVVRLSNSAQAADETKALLDAGLIVLSRAGLAPVDSAVVYEVSKEDDLNELAEKLRA